VNNASRWDELGFPLCSLTFHVFNGIAKEYIDNLEFVDVEDAREVLSMLSDSECITLKPKKLSKEDKDAWKRDVTLVVNNVKRTGGKIKQVVKDEEKNG
jgi:hypothetical protein